MDPLAMDVPLAMDPQGPDAPARFAGPDVPASPADVDLASITAAEQHKWDIAVWVWCMVCGGGSISKSGWSHKTRTAHACVSLKDVGKVDEAKREFLFIRRGGKAAAQVVAKQKQVSEAGQGHPGLPPPPPEPALKFGKHKRGQAEGHVLFT